MGLVATENTKSQPVFSNDANKSTVKPYPIGVPGQPWTKKEDAEWLASTKVQRSYKQQVLDKLYAYQENWEVEQYGALSHDPERYPLMAIKTKSSEWRPDRPNVLITGGVHGYETSGVQGALLFMREARSMYGCRVNLVVLPCVSPWGYEHIQRWQINAKDPNRSFTPDDPENQTEESRAVMNYLKQVIPSWSSWDVHIDLHETTNSDRTEFMPAKHAKAGLIYKGEVIPDGFYLVGDASRPQLGFQHAVVDNVRQVTHIAPDALHVNIVDEPLIKAGVVMVPAKELGMCCSVTDAPFVTTTEVYPDSPRVTIEDSNRAQVAAIEGAIDYILTNSDN